MGGLPSGLVTFVFTDVEGSTRMHQRLGPAYAPLLSRQVSLLTAAVEAHHGTVLNTMGDGLFVVFADAADALAACVAAQRALARADWPPDAAVKVRMGLHTGVAETVDEAGDGYTSLAVHQAARICAAAHGGQVLASAATIDAAGDLVPGDLTIHDLGHYHLRDFDQPVRLFTVTARGSAPEFPAVRAVPRAAHNVPEVFTSFVGRERELVLLSRELGAHRLVTLLGAGGVGKTRLAFEATRRLASGYAGGGWMVLLANEKDDGVATAIASATGARDAAGRDRVEALAERLAGDPLLLVLDNTEHVSDTVADIVVRLLTDCPQVVVLATSREPLRIAGEHVVRLDPLDVPGDEDVTAMQIAMRESVRLFVQRAEAADARFVLDDTTGRDVAAICRRLDGVPLAIELAAARVRHLPVSELSRLLHERFTLLSTTARENDRRHRTLHETIAWSHQLLTPTERVLFRRLAVFRSAFTLEAAEQVCSDDTLPAGDVFDVVTGLVDKSLVALADTRRALRYRMLVTIGDFAREQLVAAGEADALRRAHSRYVLTRLAQMSPVSVDSESPSVFGELEDLESDVEVAVDVLTAAGDVDAVHVLATRLARLHFHRGTHAAGLALVQSALALPGGHGDLRAWLLYREALFHAVMGAPEAAQAPIDDALALAAHAADPELPSCAWHVAGDVAFMRRDMARARKCYERARSLSSDPELDALLTIRLAEVDAGQTPSPAVVAAYRTAADHFRDTGDMFNTARCLTGLGVALLRLGDGDAADVLADAVDAAVVASADADAALAAVLLAAVAVREGRAGAAADVLVTVDVWDRSHGPAVDAMLVAHADDVRTAVDEARAAVSTHPAHAAPSVVDAVRRLRAVRRARVTTVS